jgi:hypothetical protein
MRPRAAALAVAVALVASARTAAADPPPAPLRSPGLVAGGTVLAVAGATGFTLGLVRLLVSELCPGTCTSPARNEAIGGAVLGVGVAVLAGGVVMIVLGSRPADAPAKAATLPAWVGAPGGAGWQWRF